MKKQKNSHQPALVRDLAVKIGNYIAIYAGMEVYSQGIINTGNGSYLSCEAGFEIDTIDLCL